MKVLSIIPARGGSKGIPLKNLVMLNQKPLLYYTVIASLKSKIINKTVVSTDNKKIGKVALKLGAEVVYRPKKLATDTTALEQKGGIINISNDSKMSDLDTNGPSLAGNNMYSETKQYAP